LGIVEFPEKRSIKICAIKSSEHQAPSSRETSSSKYENSGVPAWGMFLKYGARPSSAAATSAERQFSIISNDPAVSSLLRPGTGAIQALDVWNFPGASSSLP
jgi:hypothetical protein